MWIDGSGSLYSAQGNAINGYQTAKQKNEFSKYQENTKEYAILLRGLALVLQAIMNMLHDANKEFHTLAKLPYSELRKRSLKIQLLKDSDHERVSEKIKAPILRIDSKRFMNWNLDYGWQE